MSQVAEAVEVAKGGTPVLVARAGSEGGRMALCHPLDQLLSASAAGPEGEGGQGAGQWTGTAVVLEEG